MKELAYFHDKYRFNILVILDELFAPKRDRLVEFSQAIKKLKQERKWDLAWCFQTHANVGLTQEELAKALGVTQPSLSKLENQDDMQVSTLRRLIEALGGQLEIVAHLPRGDIRIRQFKEAS